MNVCPHCGRKLLSHISANCNWCGAEITDPAYRAEAEVERADYRAEQALHDLQSLNILQGNATFDPFGFPTMPGSLSNGTMRAVYEARAQMSLEERNEAHRAAGEHHREQIETPQAEPEDETKQRFSHLEL